VRECIPPSALIPLKDHESQLQPHRNEPTLGGDANPQQASSGSPGELVSSVFLVIPYTRISETEASIITPTVIGAASSTPVSPLVPPKSQPIVLTYPDQSTRERSSTDLASPTPPAVQASSPTTPLPEGETRHEAPDLASVLGFISHARLSPRERQALGASLLVPEHSTTSDRLSRGNTTSSPPPYS
jgi:hypothetical protein